MSLAKNKKFQFSLLAISLIVLVLIVIFAICGKKSNDAEKHKADKEPEGFSFLNVGENTEFSDAVRDYLRKQLGSDAIEKRTLLDLSINYKGFIKRHLPSIRAMPQLMHGMPGIVL